jgi:hypothetical protein
MANADLAQATNDIRWLAARFKGLLAAGDALEQFGSIENAITEANGRLATLAKQENDAKTKALQIIAAAKQEASLLAAEAATYHGKVVTASHVEAAKIDADAKVVAKQVGEKQTALSVLDQEIAARQDEHSAMVNRIEVAKAEHSNILKVIGDLKAKFA